MIAFILTALAVTVLLLEFAVSPRATRHLPLRYSFDTRLAEPGETIVFSGSLINNWLFPALYVNLFEYMPEGASIPGRADNREKHSLFLPPHGGYGHTVQFTLPKRGVYRTGKYYVEAGDFLGFRSKVTSGELRADITVMPKRCEDEAVLRVLGGYMGDISVRRFFMEDPVLNIGYMDYTGREPMKKIAWKQSARTGRLTVKNSDYTVEANAAVILNMASGSEDEKEKCLEIVRTVCETLEEERIPYRFLSNGDTGALEGGFGKKHLDQLMTNLGRSRLIGYGSLDSLIERCIRERKNGRSYIVISAPLTAAERDALARLRRYGEYEPCLLEAEVDRDAAR